MAGGFRADIEGLRAFAVVPIVAFHLKPEWCPGGFVGVDVFFVISGYLITRLILDQGADFRLRDFYVRRFFRLFPALLATLMGALIASWKILGPEDFVALAKSAVAAGTGVSNFYFYFVINYFNASSHTHHLLHTWSLAVEEQFYLFWPALLIAVGKWRQPFWAACLLLSIVSFAAVIALNGGRADLAFYMMPFRIFEFGAGAALLTIEDKWRISPAAGIVAGIAGMALLIGALALLDSHTLWPGTTTLAPVLATSLLILSGSSGIRRSILTWPPLRFIGRISYSLYLAHWPLITLYRHHIVIEPDTAEIAGLAMMSIVAGTALHYLVERPFRRTHAAIRSGAHDSGSPDISARIPWGIPSRIAAPAIGVASLAGLAFSVAIVLSNGFPSRLARPAALRLANPLTFAGDICTATQSRCQFGDVTSPRVVHLVGDSHALNLVHGLDRLFAEHGIKGIAHYDHGCLFAYGTQRFLKGAPSAKCRKAIDRTYAYLSKNTQPVIFANDLAFYRNEIGPTGSTSPLRQTEEQYYAWLAERLAASLDKLQAPRRTLILVKQTYATGIDLRKCLSQPAHASDTAHAVSVCAPAALEHVRRVYAAADRLIDDLVRSYPSAIVIDPKPMFCAGEPCTTMVDGELLFRDAAHLTNAGSDFLVGKMRETLLSALEIIPAASPSPSPCQASPTPCSR